MTLLTEYIPISYDSRQLLEEAAGNPSGKVALKNVVLSRANAFNANKRIYPREILEREIDKYLKNFVKNRNALGELDHSDSPTINLKNVSHNITEIHWEGDDVIGTLEVLSTPAGNIARELLKNGIRVGISSRGVGSVRPIGEGDAVQVQDDYNLLAWDLVSVPSNFGSFINEGAGVATAQPYEKLNKLVYEFLSEISE